MKAGKAIACAAAAAAMFSGCGDSDSGSSGPSSVASCEEAIPGAARIGTSTRVGRRILRAGTFQMLRGPGTFRAARPAGSTLDPEYSDVLIATIPATVLGTEPVTVSVPEEDRGDVGLLFGSVRGYSEPLAEVTFEPCPGQPGTSWPGGFAIKAQGPFTLLVTPEGADEPIELKVS